jgi:hypothetical protein
MRTRTYGGVTRESWRQPTYVDSGVGCKRYSFFCDDLDEPLALARHDGFLGDFEIVTALDFLLSVGDENDVGEAPINVVL